ncbi:uncharacterized protein LOC121513945 isoform X2 [Cheilinus undulatus]|nr:uncharacterized protein LOC121513945 isoform X2 [Cheilinus undulatus]
MQSPTQANSGPNALATATTELQLDPHTEANSAQSNPGVQEDENGSSAPAESETLVTPQEDRTAQAEHNEPADQPLTRTPENTGGMETASKTCVSSDPVPDENKTPECDGEKSQKKGQGAREVKKFVLSKKAMIDPLKVDMSCPSYVPLTSYELSLRCLECHIIFRDPKSKERHLKLKHPAEYEQLILRNAFFTCYVCDRQFTNSTELMAHQKAHTEKKPFKCPLCGDAFSKSSELTNHKKVHFGEGGYKCNDCGKICKTMTLLKYHHRKHTGEKPYVCKKCGKRFNMSKALRNHTLTHTWNEDEDEVDEAQLKNNGVPKTYPCTTCDAFFKTSKSRLNHMRTKHRWQPGFQMKQNIPIITPISISQPALLQLEANGPLQKVDGNIDTEQIRRLIESLGNVQKVNQVVILGQVPPHAPPLEVKQFSQLPETTHLDISPPKIDFMGLKQPERETVEFEPINQTFDPMEQTIILEPITPDGQLEDPSLSLLHSNVAAVETIELTLEQPEQREKHEGDTMPQLLKQPDTSATQWDNINQMVCPNEQDLAQTVILELTPALIPTKELEQSHTEPLNEIPSSNFGTEMEKTLQQVPNQMVAGEPDTSLSAPPFSVELEVTHLQKRNQGVPSEDLPTQTLTESGTNPQNDDDTQIQTGGQDLLFHVLDKAVSQETQEKVDQEPCEHERSAQGPSVQDLSAQEPSEQEQPVQESSEQARSAQELSEQEQPVQDPSELEQSAQEPPKLSAREPSKPSEQKISKELVVENKGQEKLVNLSKMEDPLTKKEDRSQSEAKKVSQISEFPLNVMSAQELVKVRKRKPTRAFFQGYMQDWASLSADDLQIDSSPAKRQRQKKAHLVVKFGPQSKEKKNKKQNKTSQEEVLSGKAPTVHLSKNKVSTQKKGRKGRLLSSAEIKASSIQDKRVQQNKEDTRKSKKKLQKEVARDCVNNFRGGKSPVSKKKQAKILQADQPKIAKDGKGKKKLARQEKDKTKTTPASDTTIQHMIEDSLLLLKGHKQPQLKVYKLDPSKAASNTVEDPSYGSQKISPQSKNNKVNHPASESTNNSILDGKKKTQGRTKKNRSLLSSLKMTPEPPETLPAKPKTTRKRKASSNIETEGVITSSHSKRALECKDCGERFSDVPSLQKHKTTVHIIESPGLTYTNGNIFEGVSRSDLYPFPQQHYKAVTLMNAATGWDTEPEMGEITLEDRERNVSFPALIPSPSLPVLPSDVEISVHENKDRSKTESDNQPLHDQMKNSDTHPSIPSNTSWTQNSEAAKSSTLDETTEKACTVENPSSESEGYCAMNENFKEDLHFEVDLVTVGAQHERDDPSSNEDPAHQNESDGSELRRANKHLETAEKTLTSQTVSCSTHQEEIKEEEEEVSVQKNKRGKETVIRNAAKSVGSRKGHLKRDNVSAGDTVFGPESEKEQGGCQPGYQPITSDSEITEDSVNNPELKADNATTNSAVTLTAVSPVVPELEPVTTRADEVRNEKEMQERNKSPSIILERVLTATPGVTVHKEPYLVIASTGQRQGLNRVTGNKVQVFESLEIKVEEIIADQPPTELTCPNKPSLILQPQQHCDIQAVLVKEECSPVLNEAQTSQGSSIRWNVEPFSIGNTSSPSLNSVDTTRDCHTTPEFNANQCIFYPVKQEEREVLLGAAQTDNEDLSTSLSGDAQQTEHQTTDGERHSAIDYQEERVRRRLPDAGETDFADGQAETDGEQQHNPDVQDFLLQSSDEEDVGGFELSDSQLDAEAEVMAYLYNSTDSAQQTDQTLQNLPASESHSSAQSEADTTTRPVDYFSKYFGWDTWVEITNCTNKLSNMSSPVTAREVAQFVGIHIAMGTLKFPSPRLYWEDLTKVPLIAEAMPFSRFLELSRMLKLASPVKDPIDPNVQKGGHESDIHLSKKLVNRQSEISLHSEDQRQGHMSDDLNNSKTDPLWKARPLLCRFKAGCQSLRRDGQSAVDQYLLPLTGKMHTKKPSLHCTTLIGFNGLLLHVDLKLGMEGKEYAVEQMVPKGSTVFLCKQELSTPAMLERLLVAGVHGAGRVGGARGQIGDEFVSSDGKLMLRRSHRGFILSTVGNGQRNMASLIDNFEKAQMSARLNRDLLNLYSIPLTASAPSCWPQAVLWYLTDLALVNSWLLYRQEHKAASAPLSFMAFRLEVSKAFILSDSSDTQDSVPPQPPLEKVQATHETPNPSLVEESPLPDAATRYDGSGHWPEQLAEGEGGRCRFGDCQRTSRVLCLKCCVFLCISRNHNCFLNFHRQEGLGKK